MDAVAAKLKTRWGPGAPTEECSQLFEARYVKARVDVRGVVLCVCDSSRVFAVSSVREPTEPQRFQAQVVRAPGALLGCWVSRPAGPGGAWRSTSPTTLARFVIEPCLLAL